MSRGPQSLARRRAALLARMPHVPARVAARLAEAVVEGRLSGRGAPAALERFYARLDAQGRPPQRAGEADFAAAASTRTGLITLMKALELADPTVPLSVARPLRQRHDRALNARFNRKPRRPRRSTRVALVPEAWPAPWQAALDRLDRRVRVRGQRYGPLASKTREAVIQAVGMCAAARDWAVGQGIPLDERISGDLAEAFLRYLLIERPRAGSTVSPGSARDYVERVLQFARRGDLIVPEDEAVFVEIGSALESEASDRTPGKLKKVRAFSAAFDLGDLLRAADRCLEEAAQMRAHGAAAARLRRKAVVLGLLVNGADRQGDLAAMRIGREIRRRPDGLWEAAFRQAKTGRRKDLGPYWPAVSRILDAHVLADRPAWRLPERLAELDGHNLLSLAPQGLDTHHPSALLREEFAISGHLVRTLVTNLIRTRRPDAAWAAQQLLGHSSRWTQRHYLTDFRDTAAIARYHDTLKAMMMVPPKKGPLRSRSRT